MKKIFFFFLCFYPIIVSASSIKKLEVENGILSREFETNNNTYSVILDSEETELKLNYELEDEDATVSISGSKYVEGSDNKTIVKIENTDGTKEQYTFYLEKETQIPVFQEVSFVQNEPKVIENLHFYVGGGCFLIILILFKVIVLGFKK